MIEIKSIDALHEAWRKSQLIIFKHSTLCGVSARAYQEVEQFALVHKDIPIYLVKVRESRQVSAEVEQRTGVLHESPQVIIVSNGVVIWHASHYGVTANSITGHLNHAPALV